MKFPNDVDVLGVIGDAVGRQRQRGDIPWAGDTPWGTHPGLAGDFGGGAAGALGGDLGLVCPSGYVPNNDGTLCVDPNGVLCPFGSAPTNDPYLCVTNAQQLVSKFGDVYPPCGPNAFSVGGACINLDTLRNCFSPYQINEFGRCVPSPAQAIQLDGQPMDAETRLTYDKVIADLRVDYSNSNIVPSGWNAAEWNRAADDIQAGTQPFTHFYDPGSSTLPDQRGVEKGVQGTWVYSVWGLFYGPSTGNKIRYLNTPYFHPDVLPVPGLFPFGWNLGDFVEFALFPFWKLSTELAKVALPLLVDLYKELQKLICNAAGAAAATALNTQYPGASTAFGTMCGLSPPPSKDTGFGAWPWIIGGIAVAAVGGLSISAFRKKGANR